MSLVTFDRNQAILRGGSWVAKCLCAVEQPAENARGNSIQITREIRQGQASMTADAPNGRYGRRAGTEACPYEWLIWNGGGSGLPLGDAFKSRTTTKNRYARADTAVRPYTEVLLIEVVGF